MRKVLLGVCVLLVAVAAIVWMKTRRHEQPSTKPAGGAGSALATKNATHDAAAKPATAQVSVRDAAGPIKGATVRLSHDGDITTVQTGADGVARADSLEPGMWSVSGSAEGHEPAAAKEQELRAGETTKIDLVLIVGGRPLTGVVTDASGGPIGGARIDAAKLGASVKPSDAIASTTTGPDGHYKLTVAEGQLLVGASEPSYSAQSRYVEIGASGATADFQLVPGGVIEGVVRDERTHYPVAGAKVAADRDSPTLFGERGNQRAVADKDGRFRLAGLRPGAYSLEATAAKVSSRTPTLVGLGVAEQVSDVEILVGGAPDIRGIVVDESGAPAPDVEVTAFAGNEGASATSDAKGAFELEGIHPGSYMLVGSGKEFLPAGTTKLDVNTKDVDGVKVHVRHGLRITGHVEPRQVCDVRPVAGEPGMNDGSSRYAFETVTTAADGEFSLGPANAGGLDIEAHCPSGDQGTKHVDVSPTLGTVVIDVKPGGSITGRVVDGKGLAVAGASVMATSIQATERTTIINGRVVGGVQAMTNTKGEFELRGLGPGPYRLRALDRGRPLPMKTESKVTLTAAEKKTGVVLTVDRADGVIKGVVTGPDGKPLADAWVSVHQDLEELTASMDHGESRMMMTIETDDESGDGGGGGIAPVLTDANGAFMIANLSRAPWTVVAEAQAGKLRGRQGHVTPDAQVQIQALGVTELKGTVKPATPLFTVELEGPTRAQRSFASADGTFSFGRVDPGEYTVSVTSSAGNGKGTVKVQPGQPASIEINLAANATVIGKVMDAAGKPVAGVPIAVIPQTSDGKMRVEMSGDAPTSADDGSFRVEAKAGLSVVLAMVPPRPVSKAGLQLEPGKTLDVGTLTVESSTPPKP